MLLKNRKRSDELLSRLGIECVAELSLRSSSNQRSKST